MHPTLQANDLLEVLPYADRSIRIGDVVAFLPLASADYVVHRVVAKTFAEIRTRGDRNSRPDPWPLSPSQIGGRVIAAWRGSKRHRVIGGRAGRAWSWGLRRLQRVDRAATALLGPLYHKLSKRGALRRFTPGPLRPRVVRFRADRQERLRLLVGDRIIGHFDNQLEQWKIQRPLRLFIDERSLPMASPHNGKHHNKLDGENGRGAATTSLRGNAISRELGVYRLAFDATMQVIICSSAFPRKVDFSLAHPIRDSSRAVFVCIAAAWEGSVSNDAFVRTLERAEAAAAETHSLLELAIERNYVSEDTGEDLLKCYGEILSGLDQMITSSVQLNRSHLT